MIHNPFSELVLMQYFLLHKTASYIACKIFKSKIRLKILVNIQKVENEGQLLFGIRSQEGS